MMSVDSDDLDLNRIHEFLSIKKDNISRSLRVFGIAMLMTAVALFGAGFYAEHAVNSQWNPLGTWTVQTVENGPMIHLGQTVNVIATKCAKQTVRARGDNEWQQVSDLPGAPGIIVTGTQGVGIQEAGCHTFHYFNPIPAGVTAVVKQIGKSRWEITGTSTPFKPSGEQGQPRSWQTETFTLAP